ncbi:MAG: Cytochrome c biogenesis protein CcsA [Verrucomicrobiae bacterium]|nr:Cytochrome c biogenesis protein CcsA [Verrucomicrobiae bacterium]
MKIIYRLLPWLFLALFATEIVVVMLPKSPGKFHTAEFGRLPVLLNGRIQPFDSVGRNSLLQIRSTGDVPLEEVPFWKFWHHPEKLRSTEWLLEVFFKPEQADNRPIFLIHHPDLISELKLTDKGLEKSGLRYYSFQDLGPVLAEITAQGRKAGALEDASRTTYQKQVLKLANAVVLYQRLKNSIQPEGTHDFAELLETFRLTVTPGMVALRAQQAGEKFDEKILRRFSMLAQQFDDLGNYAYPLVVPPLDPANKDGWQTIGTSVMESMRAGQLAPAITFYARMAAAYGHADAAEFNSAVAGYKNWLLTNFSREVSKGQSEYYFNRIKLFLHATIIYIMAFVLACGALLTFGLAPSLSESLRRSAFYLICLACVVHTFGLVYRMVLEGRPPVTNLYSSAIFIGWGACVLGLILERIFKIGLGSATAGLAGFITLLIAHNLALGGDTMEMLRAVLDTNFWLATHVVTITLGYSATFMAGALALAYIVLGVFTPLLATQTGDSTLGKALTKMVYAIICFATLFSFVGTVLGGIWADQSWGRFWGWDPKENGALIIVIWNAIILHARWGGLIRDRGLMNLAIFGNIVTAFSWFGVNMLGIGLHSYGFMDAAFKWLMLFNVTQIALILLGLVPLHRWRSFRPAT